MFVQKTNQNMTKIVSVLRKCSPYKDLRRTKDFRNLYKMPRTNDKTEVTSAMLRELSERIAKSASRFIEVADLLDSKQIQSLPLALDTFKKVAMERLEAFTRTIDREYQRASDVRISSVKTTDIALASEMQSNPDDTAELNRTLSERHRKAGGSAKEKQKESKKRKAE